MEDLKQTTSSEKRGRLKPFLTSGSKKKKRAVIAIALVAVLATGSFIGFRAFAKTDEVPPYTEYTVSRGDIQVTISGSSTIEPINYYEVTALVEGDVTSDNFSEGDRVEKGQLLYTVDSSDAQNTIERAQISLEKSNMSYQNSASDLSSLTVTSPISGKLSDISVRKGDTVQANQIIATVYDYNKLTLKVPFNVNDISRIHTGQSVTVTVENTFETLTGKITKIYNAQRLVDGAVTVTDVDISIDNPGGLISGTYASVMAGGVSSYSGAVFEYASEKNITTGVSGTVEDIYCTSGEYVNAGTKVIRLSNDSLADSYKSNALSLKDAQLSYQNTQKQLDNYHITAPISGTIIEKTVKAGDVIDSSSSKTVMAVIADMSVMTCTINVDELDISKMEIGQSVSITADAYKDDSFTGTVDNISLNGSSSNGVTTYPVRIIVDDQNGKLWPGMNVNADIVVESAQNVLLIPVSAVNRGNLVIAKGESNLDDADMVGNFRESGNRPEGMQGMTSGGAFERPEGMQGRTSGGAFERPEGMQGRTSGGAFERPEGMQGRTSGGAFERPEGMQGRTSGGAFERPSDNNANGGRQINMQLPDGVPDGFSYRRVTLGINDSSYIEVTGGLAEGDIILIPTSTGESDINNQMNQMRGGMMMTMPSGGTPPSGGGGQVRIYQGGPSQ